MPTLQEVLHDNISQPASAFYLSQEPISGTAVAYVEGIYQNPTFYTVMGNVLTFNYNIQQGYSVAVIYDYGFSPAPLSGASMPLQPLPGSNGTMQISVSSTLVTGATASNKYLITDVNGKNVAIPLYKFSYSVPEIDFVMPYTDFVIKNATLVDSATAYGDAGIAFGFKDNLTPCNIPVYSYAIPMFKTSQSDTSVAALQVKNPTVVGALTNANLYLVANINNDAWGIPLYTYDTLYPFLNHIGLSAINVSTIFETNPTQFDAPRDAGSTNLNSKIKTYSDLIKRVKMQLGYPIVQVELCDEMIVEHIDTALEWYTKYAGYTEEMLVFDSGNYIAGYGLPVDKIFSQLYCLSQIEPRMGNKRADNTPAQGQFIDYDLDSYRKVVDCWSFDEADGQQSDYLFSMEYIFAQQTYYSYVLGNYGFDLTTWHILKDWIDTREKMFALKRRVIFDERKQVLKLIPEPRNDSRNHERFVGVLGCYVEKPIKELISERWIYQYTSALTKIAIGNIRGKFTSVSMFGGGTVNYNDLLSQGLEEKKTLETELMEKHGEVPPIKFFVGILTGLLIPAALILGNMLNAFGSLVT